MATRKRKLDTPDDRDGVLRDYWFTGCSMADIARSRKVSPGVIARIVDEYSILFLADNKREVR